MLLLLKLLLYMYSKCLSYLDNFGGGRISVILEASSQWPRGKGDGILGGDGFATSGRSPVESGVDLLGQLLNNQ